MSTSSRAGPAETFIRPTGTEARGAAGGISVNRSGWRDSGRQIRPTDSLSEKRGWMARRLVFHANETLLKSDRDAFSPVRGTELLQEAHDVIAHCVFADK
jgi:hypothetical protein